jgi:tetratricopeptide (TPR) repeat protein
LYLPSLGLCIALGAIVARVPPRGRSAAILALIALVILPAAARTVVRNRDWRDNETLYSVTVETAPNSSKAHAKRAVNLAMRAESEERADSAERARQLFQQARLHYERALDIDPLVGSLRAEYGLCLAALGRYELAEAELSAAIQLGRGEALVYLYRILIEQSRQYAATSARRAQSFHGRARDLFRDHIRPVSPPEEAARMAAELDGLGRELRNARSASGASP